MQRIAPLELAESWDNPGLLVNCGRPVDRVLVTLDITPEVVQEAAAKGCGLIVAHHPVIFSPLKRLEPRDVPFQLVQNGISAVCMHTNLDAAEGGVNEVLAGIFGMRNWEPFAGGCGRVGEVDPIPVPELAKKAQDALGKRCNLPETGPAVQVKYTDSGRPVRRLAVISGAGGSLFEDAGLPADRRGQPPPCLRRGPAGPVAHRGGALRHRVPGDGSRGRKAAGGVPGTGGAGEHREPRPLYLYIKKESEGRIWLWMLQRWH